MALEKRPESRPQGLDEARRSFDVREQERQRAGRQGGGARPRQLIRHSGQHRATPWGDTDAMPPEAEMLQQLG